MPYVGRFAPSPSGPLHAGSLVAALASYLDARAHHGLWKIRIEDVDRPRTVVGADRFILRQLDTLGLQGDGEIIWQSQRDALYQQAFDALARRGLVYGCACTRREIALASEAMETALPVDGDRSDSERPYAGTCRPGLAPGRIPRAWRLRVPQAVETFHDRWLGPQQQDVERAVGDFVLKRADGLWAYQLAVVVDDAAQGVTDIVRGADLLSSTARQRVLARLLGVHLPRVMHVPLVVDAVSGLKLSKQNHAAALDLAQPLQTLAQAWRALGFQPLAAASVQQFLGEATAHWARRFGIADQTGNG
jgi:glutamyl-Q tRNA(Asp) synthetase